MSEDFEDLFSLMFRSGIYVPDSSRILTLMIPFLRSSLSYRQILWFMLVSIGGSVRLATILKLALSACHGLSVLLEYSDLDFMKSNLHVGQFLSQQMMDYN